MEWSINYKNGFTLIESLISIAILLILVVGGLSASTLATASVILNQNRSQANFLAQEGMEAVQSVRAGNFLSLKTGEFHPVMGPSVWSLVSGPEVVGKFTRSIIISPIERAISCFTAVCDIVSGGGVTDTGSFKVNVKIAWPEVNGPKEVNLVTLVTYWR